MNVLGHAGLRAGATIPLEKKILFSLWMLAKPESFLAGGDRFGLARSVAHNTFKEVVGTLKNLKDEYIIWPNDHGSAILVRNVVDYDVLL